MSTDEYVPSEEDTVDNYVSGRGGDDPGLSLAELRAEYGPEFDRFLARARRDAEAELDSWMARAYEAEKRAWQAEARIKAVEDVLDNPIHLVGWDDPLVPAAHVRRALEG